MWIKRLTVESWRGLDYALEGLTPGLNLIAGANESGKSRLVEALRFALFESSSGQAAHKKNLQTWGVAPDKPRVTVEFELDGTSWRLEKVFLGTGCNTMLRGGGEELRGEEAEQKLSKLLGVSGGSSRTGAKLEDQGIWSLLWVDQGQSQFEPVHNEDSQNRILGVLTDEIGEVSAGESGKRLLALAEAERARYYTPRAGADREALTQPRNAVAELEQRLADAVARRDELARTADELEESRRKVTELETRHRDAQSRLTDVTARHREAESLRQELSIAEERAVTARRARDDAERQLESLEQERRELSALDDSLRSTGQALESAVSAMKEAQETFDKASEEDERLREQIELLEKRLRTLRRQERLASQRLDLERLTRRLDEARTLAEQEAAARAELAGQPRISREDVDRLRKALEAASQAHARLQGAAVSVTVTAHRELDVEDTTLEPGDSRRYLIDEDRELRLPEVATVAVRPGAGEIVKLRDAAREAERQVAGILDALGVTDLDAADETARQRELLSQELQRRQDALAERVPEGMPVLEQTEAELRAAVEAAMAQVGDDTRFDPEALKRAEAELETLTQAATGAQARRSAAQERLGEAQVTLATIESRLDAERKQQSRMAERLAEQPTAEALREQLEAADRLLGEHIAARELTRERFEASGGEGLDEDLERARKAEQQLGTQRRTVENDSIRLEATLTAASGDARHEKVLDLEAELAAARDELSRVERQAAAAKRLHEVLDREYRAARERLTQPVIERIRPYLDTLFPGAEVWLDEDLALKGLRTHATDEGFEFLSGGAREQLSLLVRIGLAEVVGGDEPWPLVLDDVLVNTDASRIRRMHRALYSASAGADSGGKMQILLFTCHGALFDGLGPDAYIELPAPPRRAQRAQAAEPQG